MKLLVFGETGQVARELARQAPDAVFLSRSRADLTDPEGVAAAVGRHRPEAVVNAAAWTDVDGAEADPETAMCVNGRAPAAIAAACARSAVPFVHISSDYVFDGAGARAFRPEDATGPLGAYGQSKLSGERSVAAAGGAFAILRTSWVFSAHGKNFVKTMLRLSETRDTLRVVADQVGGPTPAAAIADACLAIANQLAEDAQRSGAYHFAGAPNVSWADFARAIFAEAGRGVRIEDIPTTDYPTPARRPLNSRLDCSLTEAVFGIARPDWRAGLRDVLRELEVVA